MRQAPVFLLGPSGAHLRKLEFFEIAFLLRSRAETHRRRQRSSTLEAWVTLELLVVARKEIAIRPVTVYTFGI